MIEATVICDSINKRGNRLTTFKLRYPRFIHAEFMTHRMLSRNASSSRAVPAAKLLEEVRTDSLRAAPVFWGAEQKGMQTGAELDDTDSTHPCGAPGRISTRQQAKNAWRDAAFQAAMISEYMSKELGVHKSICNRLLEPFSHINVVATATEWDNFFGLRLDAAAEPTMRALAEAMWAAYDNHVPAALSYGSWHLPYIDEEDYEPISRYKDVTATQVLDTGPLDAAITRIARQVSAARCARVSYEDFETNQRSTVAKDLGLYNKLVGSQPLHASPTEHQATPDVSNQRHLWGNLVGWIQARKLLDGEDCAPLPAGYVKRSQF